MQEADASHQERRQRLDREVHREVRRAPDDVDRAEGRPDGCREAHAQPVRHGRAPVAIVSPRESAPQRRQRADQQDEDEDHNSM